MLFLSFLLRGSVKSVHLATAQYRAKPHPHIIVSSRTLPLFSSALLPCAVNAAVRPPARPRTTGGSGGERGGFLGRPTTALMAAARDPRGLAVVELLLASVRGYLDQKREHSPP